MKITINQSQQATIVAALVQAAITWYDPEGMIEALEIVHPHPKKPWRGIIEEARASRE